MDAPLRPQGPVTIIPFVIGADEIRRIQGEIQKALRCPVDLEGMETPVIQTPCGHPISAVAMAEQYKASFPEGKVAVIAPKGTKCPTCRNEFTRYVKDDDLLAIVKVITSFLNNLLLRAENGDRSKLDVTQISILCQTIINASLLSCGHLIAADELVQNLNDKTKIANCRQCRQDSGLLGPNYATKAIAELVLELFAPLEKRCARAADKYDPKTSNAKSLDALFKMFSSLQVDSEAWENLKSLFGRFLELGDVDKIASFLTRVKKLSTADKQLPDFVKALKVKVRKLKGDQKTRFEKAFKEFLPKKEVQPPETPVAAPEAQPLSDERLESLFTEHLKNQDFSAAQKVIQTYKEKKAFRKEAPGVMFGRLISAYIKETENIPRDCMRLITDENLTVTENTIDHYSVYLFKKIKTLCVEDLTVLQGRDLGNLCGLLCINLELTDVSPEDFETFFKVIFNEALFSKISNGDKKLLLRRVFKIKSSAQKFTKELLQYRKLLFSQDTIDKCDSVTLDNINHWLWGVVNEYRNHSSPNTELFEAIDLALETLSSHPKARLAILAAALINHKFIHSNDVIERYFLKLLECPADPTMYELVSSVVKHYLMTATSKIYSLRTPCFGQFLTFLNKVKTESVEHSGFMLSYILGVHDQTKISLKEIEMALELAGSILSKLDANSELYALISITMAKISGTIASNLSLDQLDSFYTKVSSYLRVAGKRNPDEFDRLITEWYMVLSTNGHHNQAMKFKAIVK